MHFIISSDISAYILGRAPGVTAKSPYPSGRVPGVLTQIPLGFPAFEGRSPSPPTPRGPWAGGQTARLNCREMGPWHLPGIQRALPPFLGWLRAVRLSLLCVHRLSLLSSRFALLCLPAVYSSGIFTHVLHNTEVSGPQRSGLSQSLAPQHLDNVPRVPQSQVLAPLADSRALFLASLSDLQAPFLPGIPTIRSKPGPK